MRQFKDSGIEWIGNIPEDWIIVPTKRIFRYEKKIAGSNSENFERLALTMNGVLKRNKDDNEGLQPEKFDGYQILRPNEIVFKLIDLANAKTSRVGLSPYLGIVSPAYIIIRNDNNDNRFYYYWFMFMYYNLVFNHMGDDGVRSALSPVDVLNIPIPYISNVLQQRIADYLDGKCGEIDSLIALQEQMIEKLKAYKQSVITEAVTKGLNPNAKLVPSGIDWIGDIPEGWKVCKLKSFIKLIESGVSVNAGNIPAKENEVGVLKTSCVSKFIFKVDENKTVNDNERERVACPVRANTIIVSRMNTPELVGACGYVEKDFDNIFLPDRLWQVHFKAGISVKFVWLVLRGSYIRNYYSSLSVGSSSSMQNISQDQFANARIAFPPLSEQQAIASYLDEKCADIDRLIALKQQKIEALKDYKKSVIYEAVTGKTIIA